MNHLRLHRAHEPSTHVYSLENIIWPVSDSYTSQLTAAPKASAAANPRPSAIPPDAINGILSSLTARASYQSRLNYKLPAQRRKQRTSTRPPISSSPGWPAPRIFIECHLRAINQCPTYTRNRQYSTRRHQVSRSSTTGPLERCSSTNNEDQPLHVEW